MQSSLLVVFGLPGAGKSYVAEILGKKFNYFVYDGNNDIPKHMRDILNKKGPITDAMRKAFVANMTASVGKLLQTRGKLVIHQAFIKEFMRTQFLEAFPNAQFILVQSPDSIREQRYMKRQYFNLGLAYLHHMSGLFETPKIPHTTIYNKEDGIDELERQIGKTIRGNP